MIRTVADILTDLLEKEKQKLAEFDMDHAPTIGSMYEGLTASILRQMIPVEFDLRVVDGFVIDGLGDRSGQIDCMLVSGEGRQVPYTSSWQWHIRDVIAVLEIKKTLLGSDVADAFGHLRRIKDLARSYLQSQTASDEPIDVRAGLRAFAQTTHNVAPDFDRVEELAFEDQILYHTIVAEQFGPTKIVFGYDGFRTEFGFRESLVRFLTAHVDQRGYGPGSFPELIVSGGYSLAKANGLPYATPMRDDYWDFYFSSPSNPLLLLLEFLWTQLDRRFGVANLWGEDLDREVAHPFLAARPTKHGIQVGWDLVYRDPGAKALAADTEREPWGPEYLSHEEAVVVIRLCQGSAVRLDDVDLLNLLNVRGITVVDLRDRLLRTNLIALKGSEVHLITDGCVCLILPTGEFVAAENSTGRLTRWLAKRDMALRPLAMYPIEDPPSGSERALAGNSPEDLAHSATTLRLDGIDAVALPMIRRVSPHAVVVIETLGSYMVRAGPTHAVDLFLSTLLAEGFAILGPEDEDVPRVHGWRAVLSRGQVAVIGPTGDPLYEGPVDEVPLWGEAVDRTAELVVVAGSLLGIQDSDPLQSLEAARASGRVVAGIVPVSRMVPSAARNASCPCGSGRKYKHCHGRKG